MYGSLVGRGRVYGHERNRRTLTGPLTAASQCGWGGPSDKRPAVDNAPEPSDKRPERGKAIYNLFGAEDMARVRDLRSRQVPSSVRPLIRVLVGREGALSRSQIVRPEVIQRPASRSSDRKSIYPSHPETGKSIVRPASRSIRVI